MTGRAHPRTADVTTLPSGSQQRLSILFRVRAECPKWTHTGQPHITPFCAKPYTRLDLKFENSLHRKEHGWMKDLTIMTTIIIIHQIRRPGSPGVRGLGSVPALSQTYSDRFLSSSSLNLLICDLEITIPSSQVNYKH